MPLLVRELPSSVVWGGGGFKSKSKPKHIKPTCQPSMWIVFLTPALVPHGSLFTQTQAPKVMWQLSGGLLCPGSGKDPEGPTEYHLEEAAAVISRRISGVESGGYVLDFDDEGAGLTSSG